jgi:hypothetical protein
VHVVAVSAVRRVAYSAAEQQLAAELLDAAGNLLLLVVRHRRAAPCAIDAVAEALREPVRFVAGDLTRRRGTWELEPLAIAADSLVVPDLAGPGTAPAVPAGAALVAEDPLETALLRGEAVLEELCHVGLGTRAAQVRSRLLGSIRGLEEAGFSSLALRLRALDEALRSSSPRAADLWVDASLRLALVRESSPM